MELKWTAEKAADCMENAFEAVTKGSTLTSRALVGVLAALAHATREIWIHGKVVRSLHEVLYQISPIAYRSMVESILCIRNELAKPEFAGFVDGVDWTADLCDTIDRIPKDFKSPVTKVVVAMPSLRLRGEVLKGRAYVLNTDHVSSRADGDVKTQSKDQLWLSFLHGLE